MNKTNVILGTLLALLTMLGIIWGISGQFVTQSAFNEFKAGTIGSIDNRLDRIEGKLDRVIEKRRGEKAE